MWVSTFHSTCVRILRNQASLLPGLNSNFSIYDADDSRRLLMMIAKDMGLDVKRHSPRLLANAISNLKNELIEPAQAAAEASEAGRICPASSPRCTASTSAGCAPPTRWTSTT
jgi:DNA helicase-2/ATP-dependent DNA helicase PcrA